MTAETISLASIGPDEKTRLKETFESAFKQLQEMEDIRESLNDLVKTVAGELNVKPGKLMKYIKVKYKDKQDEVREEADEMDSLFAMLFGGR